MASALEPVVGTSLTPVASDETVLTAFLQTLDSAATRRAYRREVAAALGLLGPLGMLTPTKLTAYREGITSRMEPGAQKPLSPSSVARHLAALRSFLRFARLTGQLPVSYDIIKFTLKSPKAEVVKPYQVLSDAELARLLGAARENLRDRMILTVAAATGLRCSELCNLRVSDLTQDGVGDLIVRVRQGKGNKDRLVPFDTETAALVQSYLVTRKLALGSRQDGREYLFVSRKGKGHGRLSTARLRQLIALYMRKAGLSKAISMHSLRHGAAIHWLRNDASLVAVRKLLGHSSLSTTQKYLDHLEMDELKRAVNRKKEPVPGN